MQGIVLINKPANCTSHDIVYKIRKITNEKVGHTGTLDPMAKGVLPILIGKATKCSAYLINHNKTYKVELQLGIQTDTADSEGKIVRKEEVQEKLLNKQHVINTLEMMLGKQDQTTPIYSAIKIEGKKLYEYARKGQKIEIPPRKIEIYNIELNNIDEIKKSIKFTVSCSKGTYIRSLCEDIAKKLGTVGFMSDLTRLKVGEFSIQKSISLEKILNSENPKEELEKNIITIEELFDKKDSIELSSKELTLFINGVKLQKNKEDDIYKIYNNTNFIGIGIIKDKMLKREIIL